MKSSRMSFSEISTSLTLLVFICSCKECISLTCMKCDESPLPTVCRNVQNCGPHETCYIEKYISTTGHLKYRQGCKDTRTCVVTNMRLRESTICSECCHSDLCNSGGCGQQGFSAELGNVCYSCDTQIGPGSCDVIRVCGRDEDVNCSSQQQQLVGRREAGDDCRFCCDNDLCNTRPDDGCHTRPTTTTARSVTTVGATSPLTSPTSTTTGTTTHSVTTSRSPTDCEDLLDTCPPFYSDVACNQDESKICCAKTCRTCNIDTDTLHFVHTPGCFSTVSTTTQKPSAFYCSDKIPGCSSLSHDVCGENMQWARAACQKTCNMCD